MSPYMINIFPVPNDFTYPHGHFIVHLIYNYQYPQFENL